jgi:type IV secretory pathway TrbF-like protein
LIRASPDSFWVAWIEKRYENSSLAATIVKELVGDWDRVTAEFGPKPERQIPRT